MSETEVIAESRAVAALNFDFLFVRLNDNAHQPTGMKKWCGGNKGKTYPNGAPYHHNGNGVSGKHFYLRLFWMDPVTWNPAFIGNYIFDLATLHSAGYVKEIRPNLFDPVFTMKARLIFLAYNNNEILVGKL